MERKEYCVQPRIAAKIVELQVEHALPVNIVVGEKVKGLKPISFEYELIDHNLVAWLVDKGTYYYSNLTPEEIMEDDD